MKTHPVKIGSVQLGGENPVLIQSMTNTPTADIKATAEQIIVLHEAGAELVRVTINDHEAAEAVPHIREELNKKNTNVPLIGDFHYNGHLLLDRYPEMAKALDKWRINPGNLGRGKKRDENFETIIQLAIKYNKPIRIGVNAGSLDQELLEQMMNENANQKTPKSDEEVLIETMVNSALLSADKAEEIGLATDKIILSVKMSELSSMIKAYERLYERLKESKKTYPLHLGLTEAGAGMQGIVSSSAALAILLNKGIGDTIRISLTPSPGGDRTEEVKACKELLQALGLRSFFPKVTSCPGCGRTNNKRYQELAEEVKTYIKEQLPVWRQKYEGIEKLKVAVMGCVVNGPGEAKAADIAISLPGNSEEPVAQIFWKGKQMKSIATENLSETFKETLEGFLEKEYKKKDLI